MHERIASHLSALLQLRRTLHETAEVSSREEQTAALVADWFAPLAPDATLHELGRHGLAFVFDGEAPGPTVLLRCELDALPIAETNTFAHRSQNPGVSHKCGHDGHMTILAGVGTALATQRPATGRAVLLFQPAEETGEGAARVLADERFKQITPDVVAALHNLPQYPLGHVLVRRGTFCYASAGLTVDLTGATSHSAYPEHGHSPLPAVYALLHRLAALPDAPPFRDRNVCVTVTHLQVGEASFGIAPGHARLLAVLRAASNDAFEQLTRAAETVVEHTAAEADLDVALRWEDYFPALECNDDACAAVERAARATGCMVTELERPMRWSEDFSHFTRRYPGVLFGLGAGLDWPQLHTPGYDFPDDLIVTGSTLFCHLLDDLLGRAP